MWQFKGTFNGIAPCTLCYALALEGKTRQFCWSPARSAAMRAMRDHPFGTGARWSLAQTFYSHLKIKWPAVVLIRAQLGRNCQKEKAKGEREFKAHIITAIKWGHGYRQTTEMSRVKELSNYRRHINAGCIPKHSLQHSSVALCTAGQIMLIK